MSIENLSPGNDSFHPDISARRVAGLMQYFLNERGLKGGNPFIDILDGASFVSILYDSNLWISQDLEKKIISYLSSTEDISAALYQIGKETFLKQAFELLPTNDRALSILEFIPRIPVLIAKLTRTVSLCVKLEHENKATFYFEYGHNFKEKWYDVIFFKGMLDGISLLFELGESQSFLKETKLLGIHTHHRDLGDHIKFGAEHNIYELEWKKSGALVARTNLDPEVDLKPQKTFVISRNVGSSEEELSVVNLSRVINKSRELALENRDLEAAVEILKSFKTELEVKQKSIAKDLKLAKNIQKGIIPQIIPDWNGVQFWNYFSPMQEVSGDYYDYFPIDGDRLGIAICDVSGHGVPAAFITALSKMLFTTYRGPIPSNIFKHVNRDLLELLQHQGYTTCIYSVIDKNYTITYSVAGHPRPVLLRHQTGEASFLEGEGTFLGMFPEANDFYEDQKVQLEPGDKIFLYTDGLTEAENDQAEALGDDRLLSLVAETKGMPIRESIEYLTKKYTEFTMGTDQGDDITILGFGLSLDIGAFKDLTNQAGKYYNNQYYNLATEYYKKAYDIMPRDMNNTLSLAKSLAKEKKFEESIGYLLEYNKYRLNNFESHLILGYCYFKLKDYKNSESELKKSLYMDDSHIATHYNLVRVYIRLGDKGKSEKALAKLKKLFPHFSRLRELEMLTGD